ncbi:uncharacterized protein LOC126669330 [Mercurialis annua]|uniref:uncharacterized protein LOC126669330 n=1 Tax=Mercurialis annua TaxID=3986 RepID=UPI00215FAAFA|nr:uncharacterized protein LOC126669330 [Mercurialis annua]XP_050218735.1 uncharacterized protein LOC126669330 [Mercurialis annua]
MYRSFVTCDDPNGVVECGTIRRSKSVSHKREENKIKSTRRIEKKSGAYEGKKEEMVLKGNAEDYHSPSSFQLLEVSRGAHKLNHLIDSWSKGLSYDGQSKDIAKDLLKGALDLQESLSMLGKLQEASQYMAQLKKKQKEKLERGRIDEIWSDRMISRRFGDRHDGYSRDCIEELRNSIKDGFARQNLLPNESKREKISYHKSRMDSVTNIASSSSSQFSVIQSDNSHSTGSFSSQTTLQKVERSPNLIAKLMGLEEIPSKAMMQPSLKQLERRPVFDIEMPKLRKPQYVAQKANSERRTLKEILETVQFQGLMEDGSPKEINTKPHQSNDFHYRERSIDDFPPIVLIKPRHVSRSGPEKAPAPTDWEDEALSRNMMLRKLKIKTSNSRKMHYRTSEAEEIPMERVILEEGAKDRIEELVLPIEKEVRTIDQKEEAVHVDKVKRKPKAEQVPVKRLSHEESKDHKEIVIKAEEKERRRKLKDSYKVIVSNPAFDQQPKKERTDKKVDKNQKAVSSSRKPAEKEILKSKIVSRSPDQAKLTTTRPRKPDAGSITTDDHISQHRGSTRKTNSKHTTENKIHSLKDRKQKEKQASEPTSAKPTADILECKEEEKRIDLSCNNYSQQKEPAIIAAEQLSIDEDKIALEFETEKHCDISHSSFSIVSRPAPKSGKDSENSKEADDEMTQSSTDNTRFKTGNLLKDLLLSSVSFLNSAEKAFHLNVSYPKILPTEIHDSGVIDMKLCLDYANEFIERRSLPDSQIRHPIITYIANPRTHLSLEQLVDEVCSGVETLKRYNKLSDYEVCADGVYGILERDMMCAEVLSGIWDSGWRNGCSLNEVEQTVNGLEKLLVNELMEEVFS